jgi:hypothetical protein
MLFPLLVGEVGYHTTGLFEFEVCPAVWSLIPYQGNKETIYIRSLMCPKEWKTTKNQYI